MHSLYTLYNIACHYKSLQQFVQYQYAVLLYIITEQLVLQSIICHSILHHQAFTRHLQIEG